MSHYTKLVTKIKNRANLVKALQKLGFREDQIEVHDEAQNLYGYQGNKREQKANVIIRRKNVGQASNDLGFVLQEDGTYGAIISDFDSHRYNERWRQDLDQKYAIEQAKDAFTQEGWSFTETIDKQGQVQLLGVMY